jgi:hypothetical protein
LCLFVCCFFSFSLLFFLGSLFHIPPQVHPQRGRKGQRTPLLPISMFLPLSCESLSPVHFLPFAALLILKPLTLDQPSPLFSVHPSIHTPLALFFFSCVALGWSGCRIFVYLLHLHTSESSRSDRHTEREHTRGRSKVLRACEYVCVPTFPCLSPISYSLQKKPGHCPPTKVFFSLRSLHILLYPSRSLSLSLSPSLSLSLSLSLFLSFFLSLSAYSAPLFRFPLSFPLTFYYSSRALSFLSSSSLASRFLTQP